MKLKLYVSRTLPGKLLVPKGCIVSWITLNDKGVAEIGFRCGDEGPGVTFPTPSGGISNFRSKRVRGILSVRHRGMSVSRPQKGSVRMGFTLIPASAVCKRDGREILCTMKGDTSSPSLRGAKRKKGRR